jgi:N6-L-threonylcarbamoyladenine synthase
VDVLATRAVAAAKAYGYKKLALAGGVACNSALRQKMEEVCGNAGIKVYYPEPILCTDNAAMIGAAGYYEYLKGTRHGLDLNAVPNLKLGER